MPDNHTFALPSELFLFVRELSELLKVYAAASDETGCFNYWDKSNTLKEHYRKNIKNSITGDELDASIGEIRHFFNNALTKLDSGIQKAYDKTSGLYRSYFYYEVAEYDLQKDKDNADRVHKTDHFPYIIPKKFIRKDVPFFLEGQVHAFRILEDSKTKGLYASIKQSELYDKKLKMFKVNAPLDSAPEELGRCKLFTPGWLENESIWLHMEYKLLLELLKSAQYENFYTEFKQTLIPFLDPAVYGRSILENSSFIASSANHDPSVHGNGFVARLSGSTAELIHMWIVMTIGEKPFFQDKNGKLQFQLKPLLPEWLFTKEARSEEIIQNSKTGAVAIPKDSFVCSLFGSAIVTYHNPGRKNTYGQGGAQVSNIAITYFDGTRHEQKGNTLGEPHAGALRLRKIKSLEAELI